MAEEKDVTVLEAYYRERSPRKRGELLQQLIAKDWGRENQIRKELYNLRYSRKSKNKDGELADGYIGLWMEIRLAANSIHGFFGSRNVRKMLSKQLKHLGILEFMEKGDLEKNLLYDEFYHMAALYIDSSRKDRSYTTTIMGLMPLKEEAIYDKLAEDVFNVAYLVPRSAGMENELSLFSRAIVDAMNDILPESREYLEQMVANYNGK